MEKKQEETIEVLKKNELILASKVDELTNKLNEVIAVLQDNDLNRKIPVDYIYSEEEKEESEEAEDSEDEDDEDDLEELEDDDEEEEIIPSKNSKK